MSAFGPYPLLALGERHLVENVVPLESVGTKLCSHISLRQPVVGIDEAMRAVAGPKHFHGIAIDPGPRIVHDARLKEIGKRP